MLIVSLTLKHVAIQSVIKFWKKLKPNIFSSTIKQKTSLVTLEDTKIPWAKYTELQWY